MRWRFRLKTSVVRMSVVKTWDCKRSLNRVYYIQTMRKEADRKQWERMFYSITDEEARAKARQAEKKRKRMEEKKSDTGYVER